MAGTEVEQADGKHRPLSLYTVEIMSRWMDGWMNVHA